MIIVFCCLHRSTVRPKPDVDFSLHSALFKQELDDTEACALVLTRGRQQCVLPRPVAICDVASGRLHMPTRYAEGCPREGPGLRVRAETLWHEV